MSNADAILQQARNTLKQRKPDEARALFLQAAKLKGIPLTRYLQEARQHMKDANVEEATKAYLKVVDANPTEVEALIGLARGAIYMGMLDEAENYLMGVYRLAPNDPEYYIFQGLLHEARGDLDQALEHLGVAVEKGPDLFLAHFNFGRLLAQFGDIENAFEALVHSTRLDPNSYDAFYILGMVCVKAGQIGDAIAAFNRALEISPNVDIFATLADVLVQAKDFETAINVLNAGLNTCDNHPALLQKAAAVCSQAGLIQNAVEYMEQVVAQVPDYLQVWLNLALYYVLTEDLEKSEQAARRVIGIDPNEWQGYYHLGNLFETVGAYEKAEAEYRKAIKHAPADEYRPLGNLGAVLLEMDDDTKHHESIDVFKKVIEKVPASDWRFHYNLALAYAKIGEKSKVRALIKEIRKGAHPMDEVLDAVNALEENVFSTQDEIRMNQALSSMMWDARRLSSSKPTPKKDDDEEK